MASRNIRKGYLVVNSSGKTATRLARQSFQVQLSKRTVLMNITEKELDHMKGRYGSVRSCYFYDSLDVKDRTIHDIGPCLSLYDDFVSVTTDKY